MIITVIKAVKMNVFLLPYTIIKRGKIVKTKVIGLDIN